MQWVVTELLRGNAYNPNSVATPEMKLLELSILADGFTQPIVVWEVDDGYEIVDGFHRHLVGKKLGMPRLPVVVIRQTQEDLNDRMASTWRHNMARGKHSITGTAAMVRDLKRRNWSNEKIAKELGMDADQVLRVMQTTGLADLFADEEFSEAWEPSE